MKHARQQGFTLFELTLVIAIISLVVGMSVNGVKTMVDSARKTATQEKIRIIDEALKNYWVINKRLPCPAQQSLSKADANFGVEAANHDSGCLGGAPNVTKSFGSLSDDQNIVEGMLPFRTLGLPETYAYDGWDGRFAYATSPELTKTNSAFMFDKMSDFKPVQVAFYHNGYGQIEYAADSIGAAYVLLSYGENKFGAYNEGGILILNEGARAIDGYNANRVTSSPFTINPYIGSYVVDTYNTASDDIVHYQTLASLGRLIDTDIRHNRSILYYSGSASPYLYSYKWDGSTFVKETNYSVLPVSALTGKISSSATAAYYADFVNFADGSAATGQYCYRHNRSRITNDWCRAKYAGALTGITDTSYFYYYNNASNGTRGEIAHGLASSPYIAFTSFANSSTSSGSNTVGTLPTGPVNALTHSLVSGHLAAAHDTSPYISIYNRSSRLTFPTTKLDNPGILPTGNANDVAYSKDGNFLAVAHDTSPYLTVYQIVGNVYTKISDPAILPSGNATSVAFSQDSKYLAVGHETTPFFTIYKIDAANLGLTKLPDPTDLPTGTVNDLDFAESGLIFAVANSATSGNPPLIIYDILHEELITKMTDPATLPAAGATGYAVEFADTNVLPKSKGIIIDGLVGQWRFDEGSGTDAFDSSALGADGTLTTGPTYSTDVPATLVGSGHSLNFDGVDDYVIASGYVNQPFLEGTYSVWVKANATQTVNARIVSLGNSSQTDRVSLYFSSGKVYAYGQRANVSQFNIESNNTLNDDTWHHIILTWKNNEVSMYVDGIMQTSQDTSSSISLVSGSNLRIGSYAPLGGYVYKGILDDVRIYNRALSADEIMRIYLGDG